MRNRLTAALAAGLSIALAAAAGAQTQPAPPAPATDQAAPAQQDPAKMLAAVVDGREIYQSDLMDIMQSLPAEYRQLPLPMLYPFLLDRAISGVLIANAGRAQNLQDDAEVKRSVRRAEERAIQEAYLTREIGKQVTEEKLRARYDQAVKESPQNEEVRARHILVDSEATAQDIIKQLGTGADFATLAKEKSTDPAAAQGGDLGYFSKDQMVPEFSEAAFAMAVGEHSKAPVHTQFGWHVIKVEDRRAQPPQSFEDMRQELTTQLSRETIDGVVETLRQGAAIKRFAVDGSPLETPAPTPKQ